MCEQESVSRLTLRDNRYQSYNNEPGVFHDKVELNEDKDKDKNEHSRRMTIHNIPDNETCTHSNC